MIWSDIIFYYIILFYFVLFYFIFYCVTSLVFYCIIFILYFEYILFTFFNIFFTIHYIIYCIISFLPLDMIWHYIVLYDLFWYDMILYFDIILIWNMVSAKNPFWSSPRHRHGRGHGTCAFRGRTDDVGGGALDVHPGSGLCGTRRGAGRRAEPLVGLGGFHGQIWPVSWCKRGEIGSESDGDIYIIYIY